MSSDRNTARATRILGELQKTHPQDTAEELFERFSKLMDSDPSLREAVLSNVCSNICDELFDELVSLGKPVPNALKKPN